MDRQVSQIYDEIVSIVEDNVSKRVSRDRWGTASSASSDGSVSVLIDGAEEATPCQTVSTVHAGDRVLLNIDPFTRTVTVKGNYSKPSATDADLEVVKNIAETAEEILDGVAELAEEADSTVAEILADAATSSTLVKGMKEAADTAGTTLAQIVADADSSAEVLSEMRDAAEAAGTTLNGIYQDAADAQTSANEAKSSATAANTAANDALVQLATVEDVIGAVNWITEHGTYSPTEDASIDDSKVYYERSGSGTQADPYLYHAVAEPQDSDLGSYYELSIDYALSQFVSSHLALTDAGLYVLKDANGYKLLCSNTGVSVVDPQGHTVATYGESITFDSSRPQYIGNEDAYIFYTPASGNTPAHITIGGSYVEFGSTPLSELLADVENAVQTANDVPIVTLSSTNGTVFKRNLGVSTTIVATVFTPGGRIDNATELHRRFGNGAYLEWGWRDVVTDASHVLLSSDERIGNGGFTLTVGPEDVDSQAVITCSLNY